MNKFLRNLVTEWRKLELPFENETFLIAVSGGADSLSLALALSDLQKTKKLRHKFIIAHFNHNLRGQASFEDAEFVETLAKRLNFEFISGISNVNLSNQKGNLEQNARNARYKFLENATISSNAYAVLTAHTLNDQSETFLMRLIRGSGTDGLAGMKTQSTIPNSIRKIKLIRPLLNWAKREDTEEFCNIKKENYRMDLMNEDPNFIRVRIRKELIPLLKTFNPKIIEKISNTAFLLERDAEELNIEAKKILEISKNECGNSLNYKKIMGLSKSLLQRVIRLWLCENNSSLKQIDFNHIESIEKIIFSKKSGRVVELPNGNLVVKKDGKLIFEKSKVEKSSSDI